MPRWFDEGPGLPLFIFVSTIILGCSIYYGPALVMGMIGKL